MMKCATCQAENPDTAKFCNNCGAPLVIVSDAQETQVPVARAKKAAELDLRNYGTTSRNWVVVIIIIGIVVVVWLLSQLGSSAPSRSAPSSYLVRYVVKGTGSRADVTYENAQGGTEQQDIRIPWEQTFTMKSGSFVYLSTQSRDDTIRTITCEIWVAGKLYKGSTSKGTYVIATCSGRAGGD